VANVPGVKPNNPAGWIVRKRTIEAAGANPNRPRGQVRYGPWVTVG
jgi:hypothetical protein